MPLFLQHLILNIDETCAHFLLPSSKKWFHMISVLINARKTVLFIAVLEKIAKTNYMNIVCRIVTQLFNLLGLKRKIISRIFNYVDILCFRVMSKILLHPHTWKYWLSDYIRNHNRFYMFLFICVMYVKLVIIFFSHLLMYYNCRNWVQLCDPKALLIQGCQFGLF